MRFFVDECCPLRLAGRLRLHGHDVVHALEDRSGLADDEQAAFAWEQGRLLISADYDFAELAIRHGHAFLGLVLIGPHPNGLLPVADSLADRILAYGDDLAGYLTLLERDNTRRRLLGV
ncbi:DUF5615 family PIN-like protein [Brevundimonas staleyi]|uniref:DUF5615 family PIN-like protein n=1 Tax=Brevundimonas staleyi TaxID=74326 RepID=A0ABW0FNM7_9CAUL